MTDKKYNLPPRKWYNLEQAAKYISRLTKEEINISDLLHFAFINKLELCFFLKYIEDQCFTIDGEISRKFIVNKDAKELGFIRLKFTQETIAEFLDRNEEAKDIYQENFFAEIYDDFAYLQIAINRDNHSLIDVTRYEGLIAIYLESLNLIPSDLQIGKTIKAKIAFKSQGLSMIHSQAQLPRATNEFQFFTFDIDYDLSEFELISEIKIDNLLISKNEIDLFLNDGRVITPALPNTIMGRPEKNIKSLVLEIARETFKANPQQSRNKLSNAIFDYLEKSGYFDEFERIDLRTISNYLKEENIGNHKAKNKEKVTIKDPFRIQ